MKWEFHITEEPMKKAKRLAGKMDLEPFIVFSNTVFSTNCRLKSTFQVKISQFNDIVFTFTVKK